jgi:hypothetical protein
MLSLEIFPPSISLVCVPPSEQVQEIAEYQRIAPRFGGIGGVCFFKMDQFPPIHHRNRPKIGWKLELTVANSVSEAGHSMLSFF